MKRVLYEEEGIEGHMNALKRIRQMKDVAFGDSNDAVISNLTDLFVKYRNYLDRKSTRLNSSHVSESRMPSSA